MSRRAERLESHYLKKLFHLKKTTHHKQVKIGAMALGDFVRVLVDESPTMSLKTAKELYQIADELDDLHE